MMKFNYPVNLAIAGVLVVPAVSLQNGTSDSLEQSLRSTLVALEQLTGIEARVESGQQSATAEVLQWTEPALQIGDDPAAQDALLEQLRADVGGLQARVDYARQHDSLAGTHRTHTAALDLGPAQGTTGLDEATRRQLSGGRFATRPAQVAKPTAGLGGAPGEAVDEPSAKKPFESEGYTADAQLLGRALYRQGRYAEAAEALKPLAREAEGKYWIARCLERLEKHDEALEAYAAVIEMAEAENPPEGAERLAARAREDVEFLRWRIKFERSDGGRRSK